VKVTEILEKKYKWSYRCVVMVIENGIFTVFLFLLYYVGAISTTFPIIGSFKSFIGQKTI